jgi:hypothetical protein
MPLFSIAWRWYVSDPLAPVSPQEAHLVWQCQRRPSARSVARALTQAGRRIHFTMEKGRLANDCDVPAPADAHPQWLNLQLARGVEP